MFFKIGSWNLTKFQLNQTIKRKNVNNNCLKELKFCEVSQNSILSRCWKFQLSILKNKTSFIPKKDIFQVVFSNYAKIVPKDGACCPNFQWRFWPEQPNHNDKRCVGKLLVLPHSSQISQKYLVLSLFFSFEWSLTGSLLFVVTYID